jgi:hypothetical protein
VPRPAAAGLLCEPARSPPASAARPPPRQPPRRVPPPAARRALSPPTGLPCALPLPRRAPTHPVVAQSRSPLPLPARQPPAPLVVPAVRRRQRRSLSPPSSAGAKLYSSYHSTVASPSIGYFFRILFHIFGGLYLITAEISAYLYIYLFNLCV